MRKRLYFLLPDLKHTKQALNHLLLARIEERHIHVMAKEGADLKDLPEATLSQKSDVLHAVQLGVFVGGVTGLVTGIAAYKFGPAILDLGIGSIAFFILLGAMFGGWVSGLIGLDVPNTQLKDFEQAIRRGKILLMVDVSADKVADINKLMKRQHPEAKSQGIEPSLPAFP